MISSIPHTKKILPTIINDGWFPDIEPERFKLEARAADDITDDVLERSLLVAMAKANRSLRAFKAQQLGKGKSSLAAVDSTMLGGKNLFEIYYTEAVYSAAKAGLLEQYADTDTTVLASSNVDLKSASADKFYRDFTDAVETIQGRSRSTIKLI